MRIIIAGGRNFNDYDLLYSCCNSVIEWWKLCLIVEVFPKVEINVDEIEIVSGTATGADRLGERYAKDNGYTVKKFPADWNKHGKSAGYKRNAQMAEYADALIAFWDGKSKGTKHMIDLAKHNNLGVRIYSY